MTIRNLLTSSKPLGWLFSSIVITTLFGCGTQTKMEDKTSQFKMIEERIGGRLGLAAFDLEKKKVLYYNQDERFLMASTVKLLLVAYVLHRVDQGKESLNRVLPFTSANLVGHSPVTSKMANKGGMKIEDLCAAAIQWSDNTAANVLFKADGGPLGLTSFLRSTGDQETRSDRIEPFLNDSIRGKELDTTTPKAMASTIEKLIFGKVLSANLQMKLKEWMLKSQTGGNRLKAGLPPGWTIGDKTGTGDNGLTNDVGVIFPADGSPIVISSFISDSKSSQAELEKALSEVARIVAEVNGSSQNKN